MQERRTNAARRAETRAALIAAARELFVEQGYAASGTPEIVARAAVTRGALYHHFEDKAALLRAVVEAEALAVRDSIDAAVAPDPVEALLDGARSYFSAMAVPGRAKILLLEGPAVLGLAEMAKIDESAGAASLRAGLSTLIGEVVELDALTVTLSAAFDRAAADIAAGADRTPYIDAFERVLKGLAAPQSGAAQGVRES